MRISYETRLIDYVSKAEGEAHAKEMISNGWKVKTTYEPKDEPLMIEEGYSIMYERYVI